MAIATGTKAPDFTLKSKTDEGFDDYTLSDNFGKTATLLLFFPFSFAPPCQNELCEVRDSKSDYSDLDAQILGISVDGPFAQHAFAKANDLSFPLLSDFNKEVTTAYDVLYEDLLGFKGVAKRSAFVINKDGEVVYSESNDDPHTNPDFEAIKVALA